MKGSVVLYGLMMVLWHSNPCRPDKLAAPSPHSQPGLPKRELVVLVHGFNRSACDMTPLQSFFTQRGYHVCTPRLPTRFRSLDTCTTMLEKAISDSLTSFERIHFVGHSFGGLIIRQYLSRNRVPNLGRCVLIATPSGGTDLAGFADRYLKPLVWLCKPYKSLRPGGPDIPPPLNEPPPEIGIIAGESDRLFLGRFIGGKNDGRIPVDSVMFEGMTDFIVLPYHHNEIHHRRETALHALRFIKTGRFGTE